MQIDVVLPEGWTSDQYELIDSGADYKLERFGAYELARPDPQAIWQRRMVGRWAHADATFSREGDEERAAGKAHWTSRHELPESWPVTWEGITFLARLTPFKHTGIFPEQSAHWRWIRQQIHQAAGRDVHMLNLFGYTGAASLVAAQAGARVTHIDASPKSIEWARENQTASGLDDKPIRWIVDDALKFVKREARRGARYDLIVLDPPAFGRGPKGEVWKFETSLPQLLDACRDILAERPLGVLITSYSIRASALLLANLIDDMLRGQRTTGEIQTGELAISDITATRMLSTAIYARWTATE
jgi:23S rRNA (cytosine1962-C5)-methyltransferase